MRIKRNNPVLALIACAFLWSTGGILIKSVAWNSLAISGTRSLIGAVLLLIVSKRFPRFIVRRADGAVDAAQTAARLGAAAAYSATMILFVYANKLTTAANAILLQYTNPLWVIALGPLALGEKNTWIDYVTVALVLGGMTLFAMDGLQGGNFLGNGIACVSGLCFAVTVVLMRKQKNDRPADSFVIAHFLTFIIALPFIITGGIPDARSWTGLFALGIFQIGFPSLLYAAGITRVTAISAVFCTMIEPLMNPVWVFLFTGEKPSPSAALGGAIILGCISARSVITYHAAGKSKNRCQE